jgi:hypothetical protein
LARRLGHNTDYPLPYSIVHFLKNAILFPETVRFLGLFLHANGPGFHHSGLADSGLADSGLADSGLAGIL